MIDLAPHERPFKPARIIDTAAGVPGMTGMKRIDLSGGTIVRQVVARSAPQAPPRTLAHVPAAERVAREIPAQCGDRTQKPVRGADGTVSVPRTLAHVPSAERVAREIPAQCGDRTQKPVRGADGVISAPIGRGILELPPGLGAVVPLGGPVPPPFGPRMHHGPVRIPPHGLHEPPPSATKPAFPPGPIPGVPEEPPSADRPVPPGNLGDLLIDTSTPEGLWRLGFDANRWSVLELTRTGTGYSGKLDEHVLEPITWDPETRVLQWREPGGWTDSNGSIAPARWFRGRIVQGIFVGRMAEMPGSFYPEPCPLVSADPAAPPSGPCSGGFEQWDGSIVTAWNQDFIDQGALAPRVWQLRTETPRGVTRSSLMLDADPSAPGGFRARIVDYVFQISGQVTPMPDALETDATVQKWDGAKLQFSREVVETNGTTRTEQFDLSVVEPGFELDGVVDNTRPVRGLRQNVLTYGLTTKSPSAHAAWELRTRAALRHLMMSEAESFEVEVTLPDKPLRPKLPIFQDDDPSEHFPMPPHLTRDDAPGDHPRDYTFTELEFRHVVPNRVDRRPMFRRSHGFVATPTTARPPDGYPLCIALNGHGNAFELGGLAAAYFMLDPTHYGYWFGDAFARRGYVMLAVDISHRPVEDRSGAYEGWEHGDWWAVLSDISHNGPHPSLKPEGFARSDWVEDGERVWDVLRGLDHALSLKDDAGLPLVDSRRVVVAGLSLGARVAALAAALDPRITACVPAGWSGDLGLDDLNGFGHCGHFGFAHRSEYVGWADVHALVAPRAMVVEFGFDDPDGGSVRSMKQVGRRAREAYGPVRDRYVQYVHFNPALTDPRWGVVTTPNPNLFFPYGGGHQFRVGDRFTEHAPGLPHGPPDDPDIRIGVTVPTQQGPEDVPAGEPPWSWQTSIDLEQTGKTLFELLDELLPA